MQQERKRLSLAPKLAMDMPDLGDDARIIAQAIRLKMCIGATYNRQSVVMAPHILYKKHGELHMDAMVVEREGLPPRELKLGTYKLTGLSGVVSTVRPFEPFGAFDAEDEKYREETVSVLRPGRLAA